MATNETHETPATIETPPKRVPGRPFVKNDPRIHRGFGRPKNALLFGGVLREIGAEKDPVTKRTRLQELGRAVYRYAMQGEGWAVQTILDRTEGKVPQRLDLGEGGPLVVVEELVEKALTPPTGCGAEEGDGRRVIDIGDNPTNCNELQPTT